MADLNDLADFMDSFLQRDAAAYLANALAIKAAMSIVEDLAMHTPADTGDALSNWRVSLDAPLTDVIPAHVPSPKGRQIKDLWEHKVPPTVTMLNNLPFVLQTARAVLNTKKPGQVIFIANNVPYIVELDAGSSQQAPAQFVARAKAVGQDAVNKSLAYLNALNATALPAIP